MKVSLRTALAVVLGWSCVTSQVQAQGMGQPYATGYGSPYSAPAQTAPAPQQGYYGNPAPYGAPANAYQNPASQFQAPAPQYQAQAPNFGQRYPLQQPGLQAPAYPASFGYRQDEVPLPSPDPNVAPVAPMPGQLPPQQVSPSDALGRPIELVPLDQQPMGSGYPQMPMQTMAPAHQHAPQGQAYYAPSQGGGTMESYPSTGCSNCYEQAMTGAWQGTVWDDSVCGTSNAVAPASRGVWFGGAYGLLMRRTYESPVYLSFDPGMPSVSNLNSNDANLGSMGGLEVAFGRQMCNGWAWQVSYWGLLREESRARVSGMPDTMLYGLSMVDYMPTGYATNTGQAYYDLAESHEVFRTNEFHNIELNFIRYNIGFPSMRAGSIGAGVGAGLAGNCRGGLCNTGGCNTGSCGTSACGSGACGSDCGTNCRSWTGSMFAGARFFKFDEFFRYRSSISGAYDYDVRDLFYDIDVDNNLVGFQLGGNVNYAVGCRWNLFAGTKLGIYNNHITHMSRLYGASGYATINSGSYSGQAYNVSSSTNQFSFLSEFNLGVGYQISPCWRAVGGYRLMGATGIALAPNQIPNNFSYMPGVAKINNDGSLLMHGAFVGLEFAR